MQSHCIVSHFHAKLGTPLEFPVIDYQQVTREEMYSHHFRHVYEMP